MRPTTRAEEVADGIVQLATPVPGFSFNQYLVMGEEPLLFHTGPRKLFPTVAEAAARVLPLQGLRWIAYGHYEADECGALNEWLAVAPHAQAMQGVTGVMVSLADLADREPRTLTDGEVVDLGGRRVRWIDTPHVPHGWDAGLLYEEVTGTLLCGDLFTMLGEVHPATTDADIVQPAIDAEHAFHYTVPFASTAPTIRRLAELAPSTLGLMHGPAFTGDASAALRDLAGFYEQLAAEAAEQPVSS
jgi:flavorubredoxin